MTYEEVEDDAPTNADKTVSVYLNDQLITIAKEDTLKNTQITAFRNALAVLQKSCYTIKPNPLCDIIQIKKANNQADCGLSKQQSDNAENKKLDASNKGYVMMKTMGWTGGGLGSKTQGREEPVGYLLKKNRAGLGNTACKLDRKYLRQILINYIDSDDVRELQFESSFTEEERDMLHRIARKLDLKYEIMGEEDESCVVISKKNITEEQILNEVLLRKNPTYIDKYLVQVPELKARFYPEHVEPLEIAL